METYTSELALFVLSSLYARHYHYPETGHFVHLYRHLFQMSDLICYQIDSPAIEFINLWLLFN